MPCKKQIPAPAELPCVKMHEASMQGLFRGGGDMGPGKMKWDCGGEASLSLGGAENLCKVTLPVISLDSRSI